MPNRRNFVSPLSSFYGSRYNVSRIIADKADNLLKMEVPAKFPLDTTSSFLELQLYSLADNSLIYSFYIRNNENDCITIKTLQYEDRTFRNLLFLDLSKMNAIAVEIPNGRFSVTLNFFLDEIGSFDNRILKTSRISPSRTEVELQLTDARQQKLLEEFGTPGINLNYIFPALEQIFNQSGSENYNLPMSPTKIDSASVYKSFASGSGEKLILWGFDVDDESRPGITTIAQNTLDIAYPIAVNIINEKISSGSRIFTEKELTEYVVNALDIAYDSILDEEERNPQNYRFDLV